MPARYPYYIPPRGTAFRKTLGQQEKAAAQERKELERAQTQAAKAAAAAQRAYEQAVRAQAATAKSRVVQEEKSRQAEQKRMTALYVESRITLIARDNEQLEHDVMQLQQLLTASLTRDPRVAFAAVKQPLRIPPFEQDPLPALPAPVLQEYLQAAPTGVQKLLPSVRRQHQQAAIEAEARYEHDRLHYKQLVLQRTVEEREQRARYDTHVAALRTQIERQHDQIDIFERDYAAGVPEAVRAYCSVVLEASPYPDGFPQQARLAYLPESKQLVIEYQLPPFAIVPEIASYKYIKAKDEVSPVRRPVAEHKALYSSVVGQLALRCLHEVFAADTVGMLDVVVFNGQLESIDPARGTLKQTCLITVRATKDLFNTLQLSKVDVMACLKLLNASVSKNPTELVPVRPVLEFNMVDPRFIDQVDILATLDQRPNLMELTPGEFEALIANLFQSMGLETRLTQASRDGGVDCVAFDPRPIFGGKVVIQAKRYKHTVGVSAVRDLYGTVQNEGASKGILVTTSGYGKAAFDFAAGKPLELLSGSNLLALLADHAGIEAKIVMPDDWVGVQADAPEH